MTGAVLEREERITSAMLGDEVEGVAGAMPEKVICDGCEW